MLRLAFSTSNKPGSLLIRAATWSRWSHVGIVAGNSVIEAVWPRVRVMSLADWMRAWPAVQFAQVACPRPAEALKFALAQVGNPYDWTALLGIGLHRDWQEPDSWFCSELASAALVEGGADLFRTGYQHRITPEHLWMVSSTMEGVECQKK